jgi:hypothetical protein
MNYTNVKIVVFVPIENADEFRKVIGDTGAGTIRNYSHCSFSSIGFAGFKPLDGAKPAIGNKGELECVKEERIEFICHKDKAKTIIEIIKKAHPYEEVGFDVYPLLDV